MPKPTPPEKVMLILSLLEKGKTVKEVAHASGLTANGVKNIRYKNRYGLAYRTRPIDGYDVERRVFETEEQAEKFSQALNGARYQDVRTRSYGRIGHLPSAHVFAESNLARC